MTSLLSAIKDDYVDRVASGLADLPEEDREEVIQDLRAHLAELDEAEVESTLGSPHAFVTEFRASAGIDGDDRTPRMSSLRRARPRLEEAGRRLAEMTRWQTWRPLWIWTRGWLLVGTIAVFSGGTAFRRFPIPVIEQSTIVGGFLLIVATWLSVWLDRRHTPTRQVGSFVFSSVVLVLLASSLLWARNVERTFPYQEEAFYPDQLTAQDGMPIYNVYAYDLDGNPVDVLLFDQDGRPIRSLPGWVYEETDQNPGFTEPFEFGAGAVTFPRDEFGRVIPNLYPLELYRYGTYGLELMPPPSLGFPQPSEGASDPGDGTSVTTISPGPMD